MIMADQDDLDQLLNTLIHDDGLGRELLQGHRPITLSKEITQGQHADDEVGPPGPPPPPPARSRHRAVVGTAAPGGPASGDRVRSAPLAAAAGDERNGQRARAILLSSGVANLVVLALVGFWWFGSPGDDGAATAAAPGQRTVSAPYRSPTSTAGAETAPTGGESIPSPTRATTAFELPPTPDNPNGATRYAVFTAGKAYLRGFYPSQEIADYALATATAVLGAGNVVDEMQIDPAAPLDLTEDFPVYMQDYVLFEFGEAELAADFIPILDLALLFLQQNPDATITVVARTDAVGTPEYNLELSRRRADAVIGYWLSHGASEAQIVADPRGEEGASPEGEAGAAAFDRRVEMVVSGLLGPG
jgi:outer membrane protein OmpA-like peptidoglycan-associated protein